eukprot:6463172-Amphidinium_carterae.3
MNIAKTRLQPSCGNFRGAPVTAISLALQRALSYHCKRTCVFNVISQVDSFPFPQVMAWILWNLQPKWVTVHVQLP